MNNGAGPRNSGPGYRLLAALTARMPPGRREWGQAMLTELAQIPPGRVRRRFVRGAVRVALWPPGAPRTRWYGMLAATGNAAATAAAIHLLAPAARAGAAVSLSVLPAIAAWGLVTGPRRAGRRHRVPVAQLAVLAWAAGCVVVVLAMAQRYPGMIGARGSYWGLLLFFDAVAAGYLLLASWLPRWLPAARHNSSYALAAGLAVAIAAGHYVLHASVLSVWKGPFPGGWAWAVALLAPAVAAFLSGSRRGRLEDGLETATWAALLSGLTMSSMLIAATYRVLPGAAGSAQILADAHRHGMASAVSWVGGDNLGGSILMLVWLPAVVFGLACFGATLGCGWAPPGCHDQNAMELPPRRHRPRSWPDSQASRPRRPARRRCSHMSGRRQMRLPGPSPAPHPGV